MIDQRLIDFFKQENLYNEEFFNYIEDKIVIVPSDTDTFWFGCHPIIKEDIIKDIRLVVPEIKKEKDMLVNIHEFTHALELYEEIETKYEEKREERENKAKLMEKKYLTKWILPFLMHIIY